MSRYSRFYTLFNQLPCVGDREDLKEAIVSSYTHGRTVHVHEMTPSEYADCCADLERRVNPDSSVAYHLARKRRRSLVLHLLQVYGVDTTDWNRVNAFCEDARIAGKPFGQLSNRELEALAVKMRAILGKRG